MTPGTGGPFAMSPYALRMRFSSEPGSKSPATQSVALFGA
jgi:hypothetical protein